MLPLALLALTACVTPHAAPSSPAAEAEVTRQVEALARAFEAGDAEAVVALVSPDMHLIHPTRGEVSAADFIASVRRGVRPDPGRRIVVVLDHVHVGRELAVVNIGWRTTLTAPDGKVTQRGERDQEVWRLEGGQWKLFRGASFPVPAQR